MLAGWHKICPGCQRLEEERGNVADDAKGVRYSLLPLEVVKRLMDEEA